MLRVVADEQARAELALDLDELLREGARRMLAVALEAEIDASITAHAELTDTHGHRLVRRNGHAPARQLATGAGQVEVARPRVDDRRVDPATGERAQFQSVILPRWCRRSPKVAEVLPLRYLHGLSSSDFVPALEGLFGAAAGLSASVVTRLTAQWQAERAAFAQRDLSEVDDVSCWADGIHFTIRLGEQGRLCCLVIVGVRADGRKELVAVADGERESTDAWAELLRDLRRRGMGAPVVGVGDGALGLWRALREVFPPPVSSDAGSTRSGMSGRCTGRTCSRKSCGWWSASRARTPWRCWTRGFPGRAAAASPRSPSLPGRSPHIGPGSSRRAAARAVERAGGVGQHQAARADPDGVRVPLP
jgi:transposase-like protein